ncbi:MAG: 50S ribosomal protein L22 [Fimbriimonadaceae bacterium]|nr:50S ribosomal protein L22 [Fimbriimonadaceae bacterium]
MRVRAVAKFVRCKPLMVRQVAREVRGQQAQAMVDALRFKPGKGAFVLRKVIASAMANAQENNGADPSSLRIAEVQINAGPRYKRISARAMGRANRIEKRTAHITVVVEDSYEKTAVKPHGTKAKPRPKLMEVGGKRKKAEPVKEAVAEEVVTETTVEETPVEAAAEVEATPEATEAAETTEEVTEEATTEDAPAEAEEEKN